MRQECSELSDFAFPLYCIVLSCLTHLGPPPSPGRRLTHCHGLRSLAWDPCGCAMCIILILPSSYHASAGRQPASPASPASPPVFQSAPRALCTASTTWVLCAYCAVSSCRLQEPYCWNHTTRVLDDRPAGRCVICGIRFDLTPSIVLMTRTDAVLCNEPSSPARIFSIYCSLPACIHTYLEPRCTHTHHNQYGCSYCDGDGSFCTVRCRRACQCLPPGCRQTCCAALYMPDIL